MKRAHAREVARRAAIGTATALGAAALAAGPADAANFPVTNTNDAGAGSLRDAITSANGAAGADTITFTGAGASGTILQTGGALPQITGALDIQGPGAGALTINANGNSGIFTIGNIPTADQAVTISGLRLINADSSSVGGSIRNELDGANASELTIADVVINNSYADDDGGAIYNEGGSLTVRGTTVSRSNTSSKYDGGAIYVRSTEGDSATEVQIIGSRFIRNAAGGGGGAIYMDAPAEDVSISNSTFSGNTAFGDGGAIRIDGPGATSTTRIVSSTISGNESFGAGGGLSGSSFGDGLVITDSTVTDNYADFGGGLYLYNSVDSPMTIANTTVADNYAVVNGGGISRYGNTGDPLTITSSIVATNTAGAYGPDLNQYAAAGEPITVGNSLIGTVTGLTPAINASPAGTNKIGVDPQLGPLADNGGPTQTMAPALASPAVDAGVSNSLGTDQRGNPRTVIQPTIPLSAGSDGTDIGAVELAAVAAPSNKVDGAKVSAKKTQKQKGKKVVITVKAGAAEDVTIDVKGSIKLGKKKIALKAVSKKAAANQQLTLKLKPKQKSASSKVLDALANGTKAKASLTVTLTDADGNTDTKKPKVTLK